MQLTWSCTKNTLLSYFITVWEVYRKEWYICFMGSISFAKNYQMSSWSTPLHCELSSYCIFIKKNVETTYFLWALEATVASFCILIWNLIKKMQNLPLIPHELFCIIRKLFNILVIFIVKNTGQHEFSL